MTNVSELVRLAVSFLCTLIVSVGLFAQEGPSLLQVDVENWVNYGYDVTDLAKLAKSPGPVVAAAPTNFSMWVSAMDITSINGSPAKGAVVGFTQVVGLTPNPRSGQGIGDMIRNGEQRMAFEFLKPDGSLIGNIYVLGLSGGTPPPGSPTGVVAGSFAIIGGTGAFAGARGTASPYPRQNPRSASQTEDPSMRRINGGGKGGFYIQIWPMSRPEVVLTPTGPAVLHLDFSAVTSESPAKKGEILIACAKGLGPTTPGVNPGDSFPNDPLVVVTSPIEVLVDGTASPAINQVGFPGTTDNYRVDFRVPETAPSGMVAIRLSAAWVKGSEVRIPVQ